MSLIRTSFLLLAVAYSCSGQNGRRVYGSYVPGNDPAAALTVAAGRDGATYYALMRRVCPGFEECAAHLMLPVVAVSRVSPDGRVHERVASLRGASTVALAVDTAGNIFLAGTADDGFTVTSGALWGRGQGFLAKLRHDGTIVFATHLPASPRAIALDGAGDVYLTGAAGPEFQATPQALQTNLSSGTCAVRVTQSTPCSDGFVMKVKADGRSIVYATFLGGTRHDWGNSISVEPDGTTYIGGETQSENFPITATAWQRVHGGNVTLGPLTWGEGFVARIDSLGRTLLYSSFAGGSSPVTHVVSGGDGLYFAGYTRANLPVTQNAHQTAFGGVPNPMPSSAGDAFFGKLEPSGRLAYLSYFGGPAFEWSGGLAAGRDVYLVVSEFSQSCQRGARAVAIDRTTGRVRSERDSFLQSPSVASDGDQLHLFGGVSNGNFSTTADAPYRTSGTAFLERLNFSLQREDLEVTCVVDAANGMRQNAAPGQVISVFGRGLSDNPERGFSGVFPREASGVEIRFNEVRLPLLYVSSTQINAMIPYGIAAGDYTLTIRREALSASYPFTIISVAPKLFGVVRNEDDTVNSPANPARRGSRVALFATGMGRLTEEVSDDFAVPLDVLPSVATPFEVYIQAPGASGAAGMPVSHAGPAPGGPAGIIRIEAGIPQIAATGPRVLVRIVMQTPDRALSPLVAIAVAP